MELRYTALEGAQDALGGLMSKYVFNYPTHQGVASVETRLRSQILMRTRIGALRRLNRDPYAVWDLYFGRSAGRVHPFVQFTNLTDVAYQEIAGVPMPGRAVVGGVEWVVFSRK
jgi:iron complex outermembrane receptor protein